MVDFSAIARWPNVPACYEWLALDRRGDWRLQGERVTHRGLIEFMNRQYGADESGCWFVQNGPQRVFVDLAATPWVFHRDGDAFVTHTGAPAGEIAAVLLDEDGSIYLDCACGPGLLDDRDLAAFIAECTPGDENALLAFLETGAGDIRWRGIALARVSSEELPARYAFVKTPRPDKVG